MEFIKYKIQKIDTLESIAKQYGITIKELVNFHNETCGVTQQILGDVLPGYLEFIFLDQECNHLNRQTDHNVDVSLTQNLFEEKQYVSNHVTEIFINGGQMSQYIQNQKFFLSLQESNTSKKYNLDVYENVINDGMDLQEKFDGLLEKVIKLKDKLEIIVDEKGTIKDIGNRFFLQSEWAKLKEELKKSPILKEIPEENFNTMMEKGDWEFSNSYPMSKELQKSIFHSYLFFPFYNQNFKTNKSNVLENSSVTSLLFQDMSIPINSVLNIIDDVEHNEYVFRIESQVDKSKIKYALLEKLYISNYPFLKDTLTKYHLNINSLYIIDKDNLQIKLIDVEIEEIVNNNLEAYQKLEIEMVG